MSNQGRFIGKSRSFVGGIKLPKINATSKKYGNIPVPQAQDEFH